MNIHTTYRFLDIVLFIVDDIFLNLSCKSGYIVSLSLAGEHRFPINTTHQQATTIIEICVETGLSVWVRHYFSTSFSLYFFLSLSLPLFSFHSLCMYVFINHSLFLSLSFSLSLSLSVCIDISFFLSLYLLYLLSLSSFLSLAYSLFSHYEELGDKVLSHTKTFKSTLVNVLMCMMFVV